MTRALTQLANPYLWAMLLFLLVSWVFFNNAWVDEDAYIIFRSIEQLFADNGPVWNNYERVQVYTSPAWYYLVALTRLVSENLFINVLVLSYLLLAATLMALWWTLNNTTAWLLCVTLFLLSSAFFDYTTSGLSYPLIYLLLTLYLKAYYTILSGPLTEQKFGLLVLLFALLLTTRHDLLLLVFPSFCLILWKAWKSYDLPSLLKILLLYSLPFLGWSVFSLIYYGFPFPNTAYAKLATGIERSELIFQGIEYLGRSLTDDSMTMLVILLAVIIGFLKPRTSGNVFLAAGILASLGYCVYVGGDYKAGRFFSPVFLISSIMVANKLGMELNRAGMVIVGLVLAVYTLAFPHLPVKSDYNDDPPSLDELAEQWAVERTTIVDAREWHFSTSSLTGYRQRDRNTIFPNHIFSIGGDAARRDDTPVTVGPSVGMFGYHAGLEEKIVDNLGLANPLLARLPASGEWRIGHFTRVVPEGYVASVRSGENVIADSNLRQYYDHLRILVQDDRLWSSRRLMTIIKMNLGLYDHLLEAYQEAHPEIYQARVFKSFSEDGD